MGNAKLNGADYLLLLLYLNQKQPIYGAIRLTKMMFLFEKEISPLLKSKGLDPQNLPHFIAYNFGPFSKDLYEQVELFKNIKFIQVTNIIAGEDMAEVDDYEEAAFTDEMNDHGYSLNSDGKYYKYQILTTGERYVTEKIIPLISRDTEQILSSFKRKITLLSPKQILKYVYTNYPEYAENSLIKDEVLDNE